MRTPWEPPLAGTDAEHLIGALDRLRWTFAWKADGLDGPGLTTRIGASELTLGALLKHLAVVEDVQFSWRFRGEAPTSLIEAPADADEDWQFRITDADSPESLYARWDAAVARSRATVAEAIATDGLDQPATWPEETQKASLRRLVCDLIEEYGRHTGHADLLREAVDGRVGEDPPEDWRPTSLDPARWGA
jgi:hypothetical protein